MLASTMASHSTRNLTDDIELPSITWFENITLIWLDKSIHNLNDPDVELTKSLIQQIAKKAVFFDNIDDCKNYIESISNQKIIFIVSGAYASISIPEFHKLEQIHCILIFCMYSDRYQLLKDQYTKINGIFTDQKALIESVRDIVDLLGKESDVFVLYSKTQKSSRDLTKESASFLRFQLLKDVLLNLEDISSDEAKKEMLNVCEIYYRYDTTKKYLDDIKQFKKTYTSNKAFEWYTKDSFIYKLLNKALRTEDPEAMYSFRYYINDLCAKIKNGYEKIKKIADDWGVPKLTFYRGLHLPATEIERLKQNKGNLISTNGFLSTSFNKESAKMFAGQGTKVSSRGNVEAVVYEIAVDFTVNNVYLADIHEESCMRSEEEYLFDLDASFEVGDISYNEMEKITYVKLTVTNEGRAIAETYKDHYRTIANIGTSRILLFGCLLIDQGEYQAAIKYYNKLMSRESNKTNPQILARIYQYIAMAYFHEKEFEKSLVYLKRAYEEAMHIDQGKKLTGILMQQIANSINGMGAAFYERNDYDLALFHYSQAFELYESILPPIHSAIGMVLNNIGLVYCNTGYHQRALEYLRLAVQVREKSLPEAHPNIADTYCNIAMTYTQMHVYNLAIDNYKKAIEIHERTLPPDHFFVLMDYHDIGIVYQNVGQNDIALQYFKKAWSIFEKKRPNDYMNIGRLMHSIGVSYRLKNDFYRAELYLTVARFIREKHMPKNHTTTSSTYFQLASLYYDQNYYLIAMDYAIEALRILQLRYTLKDHPDIKEDLELIEKIQMAINKRQKPDIYLFFSHAVN